MILTALLLAFAPALPSPAPLDLKAVRARFEELAEKQDRAGCVALWKENPGLVLPAIDRDLEGALKIVESKSPDAAKVAKLHERASWGAACAVEASGHPILGDYVASFVGWDAAQQASFRAGQAAFSKAMGALQKKDGEGALAAARECAERAMLLGDHWGTAMGWGAEGEALRLLGRQEEALAAFSRARLVNHDLALDGDEYQTARSLAEVAHALGRAARAKEAATRALVLAKKLGDAEGAKALEKLAGS